MYEIIGWVIALVVFVVLEAVTAPDVRPLGRA